MFFHGKHLFLRCFYCLLAYCGDCIFVICCHVTTNEERNIVFFRVFHGKHLFLRRFFMFSLLRACIFWNALPKLLGTGHKTNQKTNIFCVFHWKWRISTSFFVVDLSWFCLLIPGPCVWTHENLYFPKETLYALFGKYSPWPTAFSTRGRPISTQLLASSGKCLCVCECVCSLECVSDHECVSTHGCVCTHTHTRTLAHSHSSTTPISLSVLAPKFVKKLIRKRTIVSLSFSFKLCIPPFFSNTHILSFYRVV